MILPPEVWPEIWQALRLTLWVSFWATLLGLPVAVALSFALVRRFPGRFLVNLAVHLPLVLPPVATGWLLLTWFGTKGPVGGVLQDMFHLVLAFNWKGAVLAAMVMAMPLMVRPIRQSIEAVPREVLVSAASLGADRGQVFARVVWPMIRPGVVVAAVMGFAKALGEFGATITFVASIPGQTRTLASAIAGQLAVPGGEAVAAAMVAISVVMAAGALAGAEILGARAARRVAGGRARLPTGKAR